MTCVCSLGQEASGDSDLWDLAAAESGEAFQRHDSASSPFASRSLLGSFDMEVCHLAQIPFVTRQSSVSWLQHHAHTHDIQGLGSRPLWLLLLCCSTLQAAVWHRPNWALVIPQGVRMLILLLALR